MGGTNAATGQGQGGPGTANGTGNNASVGLQQATVYDPAEGTPGEQIQLGGRPGQGPTFSAGKGQGPSQGHRGPGPARAGPPPLPGRGHPGARLARPPTVAPGLVRAYFDSLGEE